MGSFPFEKLQKVWSVWDLRALVLLSLFLQVFLLFASPFRKKTANAIFTALLWLAYLSADWVAVFAIGLIANGQGDTSVTKGVSDLMAFWAPFLINHLGGPDTITAFALEDNELWLRHLLQLISQLAGTGYVLYNSLPNNELLVPTILMFIAGLIKYGERTKSLYLASADTLLSSSSPFKQRIRKEVDIDLSLSNLVGYAYNLFRTLKGIIVDIRYVVKVRPTFMTSFSETFTPEEAFSVVEFELNFIYEALYTKMLVIRGRVGYFLRFVSFTSVFISFWLWYSKDKSHFPRDDVKITYTLLGGAIAIDATCFVMLVYSSLRTSDIKNKYLRKILQPTASSSCWSDYTEKDKTSFSIMISQVFCSRRRCSRDKNIKLIPFSVLTSRMFQRRWSESIPQHNLLNYWINERYRGADKLSERWYLNTCSDRIKYLSARWFSPGLRDSIFSHLRNRSTQFSRPREYQVISKDLLRKDIREIEGAPCLDVLWNCEAEEQRFVGLHIATELCYNHDTVIDKEKDIRGADAHHQQDCEISKTLSDYLFYLLRWQPNMTKTIAKYSRESFMDSVGGVLLSFPFGNFELGHTKDKEKRLSDAYTEILEGTSPVLDNPRNLARMLLEMRRAERWKLLRTVWIEMLAYVAVQCSGNAHATELRKGGQLITIVWLLTVHLGLSTRHFLLLPERE